MFWLENLKENFISYCNELKIDIEMLEKNIIINRNEKKCNLFRIKTISFE